jgi:hypothetical protein
MVFGLIVLVAVLVILDLLAVAGGSDTRDGDDWILHRRP